MHARSASFNSAVLLAACGLLTTDGGNGNTADKSMLLLKNDPRCSPSFSVILDRKNGVAMSRLLENGSFLHNDVVYPADLHWTDGNLTYGCICRMRDCINKCCHNDEVLHRDHKNRMACQKISLHDKLESTKIRTSYLRLSADRMAEKIQHIRKLAEHFRLVEHLVNCPNRTFTFSPDDYEQDHIVLQANGSVVDVDGKIYPFWNYCIDWQSTLDRIGVVVCLMPDMQTASSNKEEFTAHHVGIIVSIPFLVATFLVYAIIPELRNLYGKTLMCYVICLITAYIFLILVNYIHMSPIRALCLLSECNAEKANQM
ncbi:hypothetical protein HN011_011867 [Eciton burchellii]|nr:hypothetical protein HN011_011867 [Eciton burchellii]